MNLRVPLRADFKGLKGSEIGILSRGSAILFGTQILAGQLSDKNILKWFSRENKHVQNVNNTEP